MLLTEARRQAADMRLFMGPGFPKTELYAKWSSVKKPETKLWQILITKCFQKYNLHIHTYVHWNKEQKNTLEVDSDYGSIRWQLGKLDDLDVLANSDVACVEGGEEHELVLPVLPGVADDAV